MPPDKHYYLYRWIKASGIYTKVFKSNEFHHCLEKAQELCKSGYFTREDFTILETSEYMNNSLTALEFPLGSLVTWY